MEGELESKHLCLGLGEPDPDIAGIGILLAFTAQAFMSLALSSWVFFIWKTGRLNVKHEEGTKEYKIETGRLKIISKILTTGNDVQMIQGIALLITGLAGAKDQSLYHLRLIYETASFVGPSSAAAVAAWTFIAARTTLHPSQSKKHDRVSLWSPRHRAIYIYVVLFFAFTVLLGIRLNEWDEETERGDCYITDMITNSGADHPAADKTYIGVTAAWLIISMGLVIIGKAQNVRPILVLSLLQFPVHFYMMVVLRLKNSNAIKSGESEDDWKFGQTLAVVLLTMTIHEAATGLIRYWKWEKIVKQKGNRIMTSDLENLDAGRMD